MLSRRETARVLAAAFLAGEWSAFAMAARARRALGRRAWLETVAIEVLRAYHRPPLDRPRELAAYIEIVFEELQRRPRMPPRVLREPIFHPQTVRARWPVPRIDTVGDLAAWLALDVGELEWFADVRGLERVVDDERLRHYRYARLPRKSGPPRVIERPKTRLKALQRRVLHELLDWIPVHDAAHGFVRGRSALSHAALHTGRRVVVRLDLEDFFAGVTAARVFGIFRTAGYPESVAHMLTGLCTNVVPHAESVSGHYRLARRLATPHLPQGAPTSPALANLAAFGLDRRLTGLARAVGARYSRYADDLVLSSDAYLRTPVDMIRRDRRRRGLPRQRRQDARDGPRAPPDRHRHRRQRPPQHRRGPSTTCSRRPFTAPRCTAPPTSTRPTCSAASPGSSRSTRPAARSSAPPSPQSTWGQTPNKTFGSTAPFESVEGSDPSTRRASSPRARAAQPSAPRVSARRTTSVAMRIASARSPQTWAVQAWASPISSPTPRPRWSSICATAARACAASPACAATCAIPASAAGRMRAGSELRHSAELSRNQRSAQSRSPRESHT